MQYLENNRQYLVHLEGVLDSISEDNAYDPSKYSYDKTFDFNFYVDTEAPEITDYRVRYETYKDENDKTRYSVYKKEIVCLSDVLFLLGLAAGAVWTVIL